MFHGGAAYNSIDINSVLLHYLEALCIVSVNIYVLLSSYFLINEQFRIKKIIHIVLQTWFYSWGILLVFKISGYEIVSLKAALFPISFAQNWFISA